MNPVAPRAECIPKLLDDGGNSYSFCLFALLLFVYYLFIIILLRPLWVSCSISGNLKNGNKHNGESFTTPG